jgi:amino acid adenylation domain-containing protein
MRLNDIDILTSDETALILHSFNKKDPGCLTDMVLHERFEDMAANFPNRIACEFQDKQITYQELNNWANQLAAAIRARGIGPDDVVAVISDRSIEMTVGIIAILKSGGCYLPIDPSFPLSRIRYFLTDSKCRLIVMKSDSIPQDNILGGIDFLRFNEKERFLTAAGNPVINCNSNNLAYIIYTSGSTGLPKGVMVQHDNVSRLFFSDNNIYQFSETDVWMLFHSYCFDFSVWEIFGALLFGGRLIIADEMVVQDSVRFGRMLGRNAITVLNQVPTVFYNLLQSEVLNTIENISLRYVIFGGDVLDGGKLKEWKERFPDVKLFNMYGITETTVHVTYKEIGWADITGDICNIGRPIPWTSVYVLDENGKLMPVGIPGEICVGGEGLARGYLGQYKLTSEKYVSNPYRKGSRMYRSGDIGKFLPTGELEFLGRRDNQVEIRGHRIELREIEDRIKEYPGVKDVVVVPGKFKDGDRFIAAYILTKIELNDYVDALRNHLTQLLPRYMVPAFFINMEKLPLTSNGKINKKALPDPESSFDRRRNVVPPANEPESQLIQIWKEVLGDNIPFGVEDDFFEVGGHSLKAVRVTNLIHRNMNKEIRLGEFFENPTIRELAQYIFDNKNENVLPDVETKKIKIEI